MDDLASPLVLGFVGSFFLVALLSLTSFVKISVVLMIVRNATGLQQVPSNMILMILALFLSVFISMPVFTQSVAALTEANVTATTAADFVQLWNIGIAPFQAFLSSHTSDLHLTFMVDVSNELWAGSGLTGSKSDFVIQVPSFMISQLTEAFEMGFLLYLPFVAVDLAVTGILMAMGMQMVQPNIIAVPFKLLIFVFVDGWSKLVEGLIFSYVPV